MQDHTDRLKLFTTKEFSQFKEQFPAFTNSMPSTFLNCPSQKLISNINTESIIITNSKEHCLGTINHCEYNNSHACSPYATYISYPKTMLNQFNKTWAKLLAMIFPRLLGTLFKAAKIDQVIQLNNDFSAVIYKPIMLYKQTPEIINLLTERYPNHLILLRRINPITTPLLVDALKQNGFTLIADKPTHLFIPENKFMQRSHTKRDLTLLNKTNYTLVEQQSFTSEDLYRLHQLYQDLFIDKHTTSNPNYTLTFFEEAVKHRWLKFYAFRNPDGIIDAFSSLTHYDNIMNCGPIGYDLEKPTKLGLYRMLVAQGLKLAQDNNAILNYGSGSDLFKLNRGSKKIIEYTAVYYRHLPKYRQLPWNLLHFLSKTVMPKIFGLNSL